MNRPRPAASIRYSGQCRRRTPRMLLATLLQELGDQAGPAGLVAGADAGPAVAVEVLVEQDQVAPVGIALEQLEGAVDRPASVTAAQEDAGEAPRQLGRDLPQRHRLPRARGELDLELALEEVIEALERLDQQEVHGEPDRPAPVGVPPEEPGRGLRRLVVHAMLLPVDVKHVGVLAMEARQRADAVRREELRLVQHVPQHSLEPLAAHEREQAALLAVLRELARDQLAEVIAVVEEPAQPA